MQTVTFDSAHIHPFVSPDEFIAVRQEAFTAQQSLFRATCRGNDFLGWLDLPLQTGFAGIRQAAEELRACARYLVVIGIGGSYLGARAVIEALSSSFRHPDGEGMQVLFAGHHIGEDYYAELLDFLADKSFALCVISKSGTTTEPAIAFRLLKAYLEQQVGRDEARRRIVAVTDAARGALHDLAQQEGYRTFAIPDNVGGRFSLLTPVGLLPIAAAGFDAEALLAGAAAMRSLCTDCPDNPALRYAAARTALYRKGYSVEILANFHTKLHYVTEWWKQLFGESEGKEHRGIFPAGADFTTDLHSMGQYIQQGPRTLIETVISVSSPCRRMAIPHDPDNLDRLNFLAGMRVDEVNKMAELGTRIAHVDGGVPNMAFRLPELNAHTLGQLFYLFELACGISGCMLGVNPFDQPGVEDYKNNMFALLGKPGYEQASRDIKIKLENSGTL